MDLHISNSSGKPIYEQIMIQIKRQILSGVLKEGDALPSIRLLAKELRISVITTKRAYDELEREGFLHSVVGKGTFVAHTNLHKLQERHLREMESQLQIVVRLAKISGISFADLTEMLALQYKEES